ncbi:putative 2-oxoglutarate-dependent ethylene succinate-forming enzyme protein [Phaeoacremonium minimum UCRPA7]|uniref:Putative 2-oxoglutarate-dependent ethylene succinate-forming enzyme protein n=1 Tax=Phaeoacremonium minimum (strain UCR-PA7) TaxID=1286976 RepID=R8BM14_PHAM7|nr:putative 2-oxoglutarate-dependent ethylene succinate-forming enzyme protein [Phaeoacremonium minimum UCRPA7]EOO00389.1 putative 2-oxoglutarate-dependent ethylene succinate-forming enzyme protein [Phaeoacremonium minimum UCRPA7]
MSVVIEKPLAQNSADPAGIPPGYNAKVGYLQTFVLPEKVSGSDEDVKLGKAIIAAWKKDGILQISMKPEQQDLYKAANASSKRFFSKSYAIKSSCVDSQSYAGYIASGEELTDGIADYSEIFTVTKDLPLDEPRVVGKWPCHGRCPWPDADLQQPMKRYMDSLGGSGEILLALTELGLGTPKGSLTQYTRDGWHHMRILRFPAMNNTNGKGKDGRGIGSHTDYGLLVLAAADDVGALLIRPPNEDEVFANWEKSAAGYKEDDEGWIFVPPAENVFTVFPGRGYDAIPN